MLRAKLKQIFIEKKFLAILGLGLLLMFSHAHLAGSQAVIQGYNTDDSLQSGMIVMFKQDDTSKVAALTAATPDKMQGVVVNPNDAPVTISSGDQKVYVATTGHYDVLVSDQGGEVKPGDYITISSVDGIGMKAGSTQPVVLGKALTGFDGKNGVLGNTTLKDKAGKQSKINFGKVTVDISISRNPQLKVEANVPSSLRKVSEAVAQRDVTANRIYLGMVMIFITSFVAAVVLYAGVRSSIVALGRNPLSRKSIFRSLIQVIVTSVIIFLCGLFGVYLLLKL